MSKPLTERYVVWASIEKQTIDTKGEVVESEPVGDYAEDELRQFDTLEEAEAYIDVIGWICR